MNLERGNHTRREPLVTPLPQPPPAPPPWVQGMGLELQDKVAGLLEWSIKLWSSQSRWELGSQGRALTASYKHPWNPCLTPDLCVFLEGSRQPKGGELRGGGECNSWEAESRSVWRCSAPGRKVRWGGQVPQRKELDQQLGPSTKIPQGPPLRTRVVIKMGFC